MKYCDEINIKYENKYNQKSIGSNNQQRRHKRSKSIANELNYSYINIAIEKLQTTISKNKKRLDIGAKMESNKNAPPKYI